MRKTLFLISILLVSCAFAQAQDKPQAYKFDEFGDLKEGVWKERLDNFSKILVSQPDAKLHIIVYAESGKSRVTIEESIRQYKNYLRNNKKIEWEKFDIRRGGFKSLQTVELWIVPKNAELPNPTPIEKFKSEKIAELGYVSDEDLKKSMEDLHIYLMSAENNRGYIINYGSGKKIKERVNKLIEFFNCRHYVGHNPTFVDVEQAGSLKTVIWIVPRGENYPEP